MRKATHPGNGNASIGRKSRMMSDKPRDELFVGMGMSPEECSLVPTTFEEIARRPWCDRSDANDAEFAEIILRTYRSGKTDPGQLLNYCEAIAKLRFSR